MQNLVTRVCAAVAACVLTLPATAQSCLGDLNADRAVNGVDIGILLNQWGQAGTGDLDSDGTVGVSDLGAMLGVWGACLPSLTGHVTYSDGAVASNVTVTATPTTNGNAQTVAQTDDFGRYSLYLTTATYNIDVQFSGNGFATQGIGCLRGLEVAPGSSVVADLVVSTAIWSGIVTNSVGEPISGANLRGIAFATNSCCGGFDSLDVITGLDGRFSVRVHPNDYMQLTVTADGYGSTYLPNQTVTENVNSTYVVH
jgi:hypothetical protein